MLKIKDDVDLEILKKYGFERNYIIDSWCWLLETHIGNTYGECIIIWECDRKIQINAIELLTIVYDLIKDDLVEKV